MNPVGQPISRLDGRLKVTGTAHFAGDWSFPNVAHAVIFQSAIAKGKIKSFELKDARQVPGVIEILTFENAPKIEMPKAEAGGGGAGESFVPLQDAVIHYNGQHIGAVIAETLEAATQAARLVKIRYAEDAARTDMDQLLKESYVVKTMAGMGPINYEKGKTASALKTAAVTLAEDYSSPLEHHNPMEPSATVAFWQGDKIQIYDATQSVWNVGKLVSQAFQVDHENVQVITKFVGGAFGCKGAFWPHQFIAIMATKKTGRPVKLVLKREQMFTGVGHRARTLQTIRLGSRADGTLEAIEHEIVNNTAVNKDYSERSGTATPMLYACPNIKTTHRLLKLNYQVPTFMRAPGEVTGAFALESAMDELAHRLKIDPVELRLKNYAKDQDGKPFSSKSLSECYAQAAQHFGWANRDAKPASQMDGAYFIGQGMATSTYPAKRFGAKAEVELFADGTAKVRSATQDLGTGSYTIFTQIAAQELGLELAKVDFDLGNSHFPQAGPSGGSTTAASVGTAIHLACASIREQLFKLATSAKDSKLTGKNPAELELRSGLVRVKDSPVSSESVGGILARNSLRKISALGENPATNDKRADYSTHSFGAQFYEVRVHSLTGEVQVTRAVGAFACGKIINPKTARSQFHGGMIMGIGMALMEATVADTRTGRLVVRDLADYHLPVQADISQLDVIVIEERDEHVNPIGVKGIGEIGIVGTAPALANAIFNATGVRLRDLPLTPDKMIQAWQAP